MMERRPLASRNWRFSILLAGWLARQARCRWRFRCWAWGGLIAGLAFWYTTRGRIAPLFWLLGAALVQLRLLCNLIDGMVAVEAGQGLAGGRVIQ